MGPSSKLRLISLVALVGGRFTKKPPTSAYYMYINLNHFVNDSHNIIIYYILTLFSNID